MPITSRRIGATNGRSGMANSSRYADRVIGASNKKKRSAAIAVTSASMVGLLIQGIRPIAERRGPAAIRRAGARSLETPLRGSNIAGNCSPGLTRCRQNGRPAPRDRPNCRQCPLRARDKIEFYNKRRRGIPITTLRARGAMSTIWELLPSIRV